MTHFGGVGAAPNLAAESRAHAFSYLFDTIKFRDEQCITVARNSARCPYWKGELRRARVAMPTAQDPLATPTMLRKVDNESDRTRAGTLAARNFMTSATCSGVPHLSTGANSRGGTPASPQRLSAFPRKKTALQLD